MYYSSIHQLLPNQRLGMTTENIWDLQQRFPIFPITHLSGVPNNVFSKYFDLWFFLLLYNYKNFHETILGCQKPSYWTTLTYIWLKNKRSLVALGWELCFVLTQSFLELEMGSRGAKSCTLNYSSLQGLAVVDWEGTSSVVCYDLLPADVHLQNQKDPGS